MSQQEGKRDKDEILEPELRSRSLRDAFPGHFRPTDEEFNRLWNEGMFVVDTNVLLNLYRYTRATRDELLAVLRALSDKLFLPHQVGQEFLNRRLTISRSQRIGLAKLRERVTAFHEEIEKELHQVLRLRSGEELLQELRDALEKDSPGGYTEFTKRIKELEESLPKASNSPEMDETWVAVEKLFDGKVGPAYEEEEMRRAVEEANYRKEERVPPGYKDQRPGDYLLWRQTLDEAKRSGRPVVLITDDRKEDWWWIEEGETLGPSPQLVLEMGEDAQVPFYMYTPDRLMKQARERLGVEVSDRSISEAAEGFGQEEGNEDTRFLMAWLSRFNERFPQYVHQLSDIEKVAVAIFAEHRNYQAVADRLEMKKDDARRILVPAIRRMNAADESEDAILQTPTSSPTSRPIRRVVGRKVEYVEDPDDSAYDSSLSVTDAERMLEVAAEVAPPDLQEALLAQSPAKLAARYDAHRYDLDLLLSEPQEAFRLVMRLLYNL